MAFPGTGIPYVPTADHVGQTLKDLAPQIAAEYAHVLWEAYNNATRKARTQALILDPRLEIALALASEALNRFQAVSLPSPPEPELPQVWGALGDLTFSILTAPDALEIQDGVTYARQTLICEKPHLQWTGYELQEIKLPLRWHHLVHPDIEGQLKALLQAMNERQVLPLVIGGQDGTGLYAGSFVIPRISRQVTRLLPDGRIAAVDLSVELLEWVGDPELVMGKAAPAVRAKSGPAPASRAQSHYDPATRQILPGGK
ncbi:MAG: phage tail protein [Acidobacteria bacterium]|nr:phage tail protein [Acidobacteriota bacterium]